MSILELMAQNEKLVGDLYRKYSGKFPEYAGLWDQLAHEEDVHAKWLINLQNKLNQGLISVNNRRFNESAVKMFSEYLNNEIAKLESENVSLIMAFSTSLYIEESLIEHKYFEVLDSDSQELKNTLTKLKNETDKHFRTIKEVWLRYKK